MNPSNFVESVKRYESTVLRPHVSPEPATGGVFPRLVGLLTEIFQACGDAGRDDLAGQMAARQARVADPDVVVVIAGEYKGGKSSLVNALVGADLCPVDEDVATAVPTIVRYAPEALAWVRREADDEDPAPPAEPVAIEALAAYVSEQANPGNRERVRSVEVGIPAAVLRDGLVLVDTPGVGGLVSSQTVATLASLSLAQAALFVSDATQEYTGPELEFLAAARQVCPAVLPVLTKVDLAPPWPKIKDLDQGWLEQAGVTAGIVAVSSALSRHGRTRRRTDLEGESGLQALVDRLRQVLHEGRMLVAADAVAEIHSVLGQLAAPVTAAREALVHPSSAIADLEAAEQRAARLASDTAEWLLLLDDGLTDLEDQLVEEVTNRMRVVTRDAEQTIMKSDPAAQ
jgi:GTPase Era involved in 16S rRNA processing